MPNECFWAVHKGHKQGVYRSWSEASKQIHGFSGALHKKFTSYDQATRYAEYGNLKVVGAMTVDGKTAYVLNEPANNTTIEPISNIFIKKRKIEETDQVIQGSDQVDSAPTPAKVKRVKHETPPAHVPPPIPPPGNVIVVDTDGACRDNKRNSDKSRASYGVFFGDDDPMNDDGMVPFKPWTNQRAELYAILKALEIYEKQAVGKDLWIRTDSSYSINIFGSYIRGWKLRGFVTSKGTPVENQDLIMEIDKYIQRYPRTRFIKVKGHSGDYGNEKADGLANHALDEYEKRMGMRQ